MLLKSGTEGKVYKKCMPLVAYPCVCGIFSILARLRNWCRLKAKAHTPPTVLAIWCLAIWVIALKMIIGNGFSLQARKKPLK